MSAGSRDCSVDLRPSKPRGMVGVVDTGCTEALATVRPTHRFLPVSRRLLLPLGQLTNLLPLGLLTNLLPLGLLTNLLPLGLLTNLLPMAPQNVPVAQARAVRGQGRDLLAQGEDAKLDWVIRCLICRRIASTHCPAPRAAHVSAHQPPARSVVYDGV